MWRTLLENPRLILFGLLAAFFSGPGQSYLVSFFLPGIQSELSLSASQIGDIYFFATLGGSMALPLVGRLLDRSELARFSLFMGFCLAMGCLILSIAHHAIVLLLGLLLIRCFGQGAMSVISTTVISRSFKRNRGKALALVSQGYPFAEMLLPILISTWLIYYDWRSGWVLLAALILLVYMPSTFFLLKSQSKKRDIPLDRRKKTSSWKVSSIVKDYRFYIAVFSALVLPGALTGLFIYQVEIARLKTWDIQVMATAFVFFGIARSVMGFAVGPIIDKISGRRLLGFVGIPFALGLICLRWGEMEFAAFAFLALAGLSVGAGGNARTAFWAEVYGVENLGALRGVIALLMVISTAITPPVLGRLLDAEVPLEIMLDAIIVLAFLGSLLGFLASWLYRPRPSPKRV